MKKSKNVMTFWSDGEPVAVVAKGRLSVGDFNTSLKKEWECDRLLKSEIRYGWAVFKADGSFRLTDINNLKAEVITYYLLNQ